MVEVSNKIVGLNHFCLKRLQHVKKYVSNNAQKMIVKYNHFTQLT